MTWKPRQCYVLIAKRDNCRKVETYATLDEANKRRAELLRMQHAADSVWIYERDDL